MTKLAVNAKGTVVPSDTPMTKSSVVREDGFNQWNLEGLVFCAAVSV